jgi:magnesium-protoporphyrin O-methyltransferase
MTFAPRTPALTLMHSLGKLFPAGDRAPAIEPVTESELLRRIGAHEALQDFRASRSERVASGFYTSQALEVVRR